MTLLLLLACGGPQAPTEFLDTGELVDQDQDGVGAKADCNDLSPTTYPGATETCDSRDEDCDGVIDEEAGPTWYADSDDDGYGDPDAAQLACTAPEATVSNSDDCDDSTDAISPAAPEDCNDLDDDCDDAIDEAGQANTFYLDADFDGYGVPDETTRACTPPSGYAVTDDDCDDDDFYTHPDAAGDCTGADRDCSGRTEDDELVGYRDTCPGETCGDILARSLGVPDDGVLWIDPTGSGEPFQAWCDMSTDGGGYTIYKHDLADAVNAEDAEDACAVLGLHLFVPRSQAHLAAAFAVAMDPSVGAAASDEYLTILAIFPEQNGAFCKNTPFNSDNADCRWYARDRKGFWVSDRTDIPEPSGDNDTRASMVYSWESDGTVLHYYDDRYPGGVSARFLCSVGDK